MSQNNAPHTSELLDKLFQNMTVRASISRNTQGADTLNLDVPEFQKVFVFDNATGEYLGMLKRAADVPAEVSISQQLSGPQIIPGLRAIRLPMSMHSARHAPADTDGGDPLFDAMSLMEKMFGQ